MSKRVPVRGTSARSWPVRQPDAPITVRFECSTCGAGHPTHAHEALERFDLDHARRAAEMRLRRATERKQSG